MNKFDLPEGFFDGLELPTAEPLGAGYPAPLCPKCGRPLLVPGQHAVSEVQCVKGCLSSVQD